MARSSQFDLSTLGALVRSMPVDDASALSPSIQKTIRLARHLQRQAVRLQTPQERRQQQELERMMQTPSDKATLIQMTDQAFRSERAARVAEQLTHILDVQGVPRFFSAFDKAMLRGFQSFGGYLPGVSVPLVKEKMRAETANVILPAESEVLRVHLDERRAQGLRMNVNYLGEALLGEADAQRRLDSYLAALQLPEVEVLSVKVSTIYSQIRSIAHEQAVSILSDRMEQLYRAAAAAEFTRADGSSTRKFVYLDMEEYRDLSITVETFMRTLSRPGLESVSAGIALQAYIPDSAGVQRRLTAWAKDRVAAGGAPITVRIVKGANMEMERVEASIEGWPQAPFQEKSDTDANYKQMVEFGLRPENAAAVHVGVASHNLFDLSYALVLTVERDVGHFVQFEMLEGMANHQRRALAELAPNILLYAPATYQHDFINAIGYLIRRLDENTGDDNFLRHAFKLEVDSPEWAGLERDFVDCFDKLNTFTMGARRTQDRAVTPDKPPILERLSQFDNEPDTDFSLPQNRRWAQAIIDRWQPRFGDEAVEIPLRIGGQLVTGDRPEKTCLDPSRPGVVVGRYRQASLDDVDRALACAHHDPAGWRDLTQTRRGAILSEVAHALRARRGDLIGAAIADGGKLITETDPEISEAIDFVEYYAASALALTAMETVTASPKGVVVVVPPWNFPVAIPCGGIAASLAAGNTVILKPASNTVLAAYTLCEAFWAAGVPEEALQFVPCSGATGGARLVSSPIADVVILTGGTDTALRMLEARPEMMLLAETGGKNATIVTGMSDREQAVKHVLQSAFGHTGQKCSATSLLILEGEVFDDEQFRATLCDAASSWPVGTAWSLDSRLGPMIAPPSGDLERGLTTLEDGESWALEPQQIGDNPCLYRPGIKWDVQPGSYTHLTEFFGPLLAVMKAKDLEHAIHLVNQTGFGLTSGIESLDQRELAEWRERIRAGNLYINRGTTGAIVHRQPFGGMGKSAFGPGIKAGGPNYVAQLMDFEDVLSDAAPVARPLQNKELELLRQALLKRHPKGKYPEDLIKLLHALYSYERAYQDEFGLEHDDFKLVGQDNIRRYLPARSVCVRVHRDDSAFEIFARVSAAITVGSRVAVSVSPGQTIPMVGLLDELTASWGAMVEFVEETDAELAALVRSHAVDRVRYARPERAATEVLAAVEDSGIFIARSPVLAEGRIELLWYQNEQSISADYHRYGNLGQRTHEARRPVR